ncbi:TPA: sulfotransferase [Pseudomonas aeruginosa]|nr:sulfotransferase [Pseudomonas aeruginosa]HCK5646610.1 sulfotransferase [Pseudomonas aeruginosa]
MSASKEVSISCTNQPIVVVLGMHRSGTSTVTRALQTVGVSLGDRLMPADPGNNDKGFFEDLDIINFNERLLSAVGHAWHSICPLKGIDVDRLCEQGYLKEAIRLLRKKSQPGQIFGFKDPRTAKLLSFWLRVFQVGGFEARYVIAVRHPLSVADSLAKRDGLAPERSYLLWITHVLTSLRGTAEDSRILIDYDQFVAEPQKTIGRLAEFLKTTVDTTDQTVFLRDFLSEDLRHSFYLPQDVWSDSAAIELAKEIFTAISDVAANVEADKNFDRLSQLDRWETEFSRIQPLLGLVDRLSSCVTERDGQIASLGQAVTERDGQIASLGQAVTERDGQIASLGQAVTERDGQIASLGQAVTERDRQIAILSQAITERDGQLSSLGQAMGELTQEFSRQASLLVNLQHSLDAVYASRSWRLAAPVRALGSLLRKPRKLWWVYRDLRKQHALRGLLARVVRVWRIEGLAGLKQRAIWYWLERHPASTPPPPISAVVSAENASDENAPSAITAAFHQQFRSLSLADYDVVSFDVFDTALLRLVRQPTDVFRYIEQTHGLQGFYHWRIKREVDERRLQPAARDISLNDIYRDHPEWLPLEVAAERAFCVANPEVFELYRKAVTLKKLIYFVSDMYLRHEDIEHLLDDAGYQQRDALLVSSKDDLIKGDGSRFRDLQSTWADLRVLHVGDNRLADVEWPKKLGFDAFHYQEPDVFFAHDALVSGFAKELKAATLSGSPSSLCLSHLLGGYRYWKLGIERSGPSSVWRSVGFLYAGPLLLSFVRSLREQMAALPSLGGVYFLARDGDIIKQVFDRVYAAEGYRSHYMYASRRCMTFPLLVLDNVPDEVLTLYGYCDAHTSVDDIFNRFDYPELTALQQDLLALEQKQLLMATEVMRVIKKHKSSIAALAQKERDDLLAYLQSIGFCEADALVVDVGWSGTIQDCLQLLTESLPNQVHGAYLGVWPHAKCRANKSGFLFSPQRPELATRLQPFIDFMELLTSSPLESVKHMARDDQGQLYPCYFAATEDEKKRQKVSLDIQSGVMEYVHWALGSSITPSLGLSVEVFVDLCELLRDQASPELRASFNALRHSRIVNGGHDFVILPFSEANS